MSNIELQSSAGLLALIEANAPFWGAEAEVIRSYWDAPIRNAETDRKWLTHQVYKVEIITLAPVADPVVETWTFVIVLLAHVPLSDVGGFVAGLLKSSWKTRQVLGVVCEVVDYAV